MKFGKNNKIMKIVYAIISDNDGQHFCYKKENSIKWIAPSIKQCHFLNQDDEIIIITDDLFLKEYLPFATFYDVKDYIDENVQQFNKNYIHLSTNQYNFEKNAIMRYMILNSFCKTHNINRFLHLELDVLVFSDVKEDADFFKNYDITLLHGMAAGCCFFNNATKVLSEYVDYVLNSYSNPQKDPMGFNLEEERIRYNYNINNKIGAGGVSDMHFWSLYKYLHDDKTFKQMDENIDGVFYQTCMIDQKKNGKWEHSIEEKTEIKKLLIEDNKCFGFFNDNKVRIKYLHCHGHTKLFIPKYTIKNL